MKLSSSRLSSQCTNSTTLELKRFSAFACLLLAMTACAEELDSRYAFSEDYVRQGSLACNPQKSGLGIDYVLWIDDDERGPFVVARVEKVVPGCIGSSIGLQVGDYIETIGGQKMRASPESVQYTIVREEGEDAIREGIVSAFPRPEEMLEKTDALVDVGFRRGGQTFERSLGPGEGQIAVERTDVQVSGVPGASDSDRENELKRRNDELAQENSALDAQIRSSEEEKGRASRQLEGAEQALDDHEQFLVDLSCKSSQEVQDAIDNIKKSVGTDDELEAWNVFYRVSGLTLPQIGELKTAAERCNAARGTKFYVPDPFELL